MVSPAETLMGPGSQALLLSQQTRCLVDCADDTEQQHLEGPLRQQYGAVHLSLHDLHDVSVFKPQQ